MYLPVYVRYLFCKATEVSIVLPWWKPGLKNAEHGTLLCCASLCHMQLGLLIPGLFKDAFPAAQAC